MTENERLTEKRDGKNVIPLRQDGKTKWSLASAGMGDASTQFLYGTHADKLADYEAIGTVEEIQQKLKNMSLVIDTDRDLLNRYIAIGTIEEFKALKEGGRFLEFLYNHIPPNEMEQYLSMYQAKDKVAVNGYADQCGLMPAT